MIVRKRREARPSSELDHTPPSRTPGASFFGLHRNKYHNVRTELDGRTFASIKEAKRWSELRLLEKAGEISKLQVQPRYPIKIGDTLVCTYVADFSYWEGHGDDVWQVVEDCKGYRTEVYKLKRKLMLAVWGIEIREV